MTAVLRCKPRLRDPVGRCVPVEHWLVVIPLPAMVRPGNAGEAISAAVPSDAHPPPQTPRVPFGRELCARNAATIACELC